MREQIYITKAVGSDEATDIHLVTSGEEELDQKKLEAQAKRMAYTFSTCLPSLTFDLLIKEMLKVGCAKRVKQVCPECNGEGSKEYMVHQYDADRWLSEISTCERCNGRGVIWVEDESEEVNDGQ